MKRTYLYLVLICSSTSFYSCVSLLPVNNHYEKAGTLQKGNVEVSGHVTRYDVKHYGRTEISNRNYGFRVGYGITDRIDFKLRYERMKVTPYFDGLVTASDCFSFVPKFAIAPENFAIMTPFSTYSVQLDDNGRKRRKTVNSFAPQLIFSVVNRKKQVDFTISGKTDFLWEIGPDAESNLYLAASFGMGFSSDLRKWAIRPEIGYAMDGTDSRYISYGIGFQWIIPTGRK